MMSRYVTVRLTVAEALALNTLAGEGAEAFLNDRSCINGYLGGMRGARAAQRGLDKLRLALKDYQVRSES